MVLLINIVLAFRTQLHIRLLVVMSEDANQHITPDYYPRNHGFSGSTIELILDDAFRNHNFDYIVRRFVVRESCVLRQGGHPFLLGRPVVRPVVFPCGILTPYQDCLALLYLGLVPPVVSPCGILIPRQDDLA